MWTCVSARAAHLQHKLQSRPVLSQDVSTCGGSDRAAAALTTPGARAEHLSRGLLALETVPRAFAVGVPF